MSQAEVIRARNKLANASRLYGGRTPDPEEVAEARRELAVAKMQRAIEDAVAAAPPLTDEQRASVIASLQPWWKSCPANDECSPPRTNSGPSNIIGQRGEGSPLRPFPTGNCGQCALLRRRLLFYVDLAPAARVRPSTCERGATSGGCCPPSPARARRCVVSLDHCLLPDSVGRALLGPPYVVAYIFHGSDCILTRSGRPIRPASNRTVSA